MYIKVKNRLSHSPSSLLRVVWNWTAINVGFVQDLKFLLLNWVWSFSRRMKNCFGAVISNTCDKSGGTTIVY